MVEIRSLQEYKIASIRQTNSWHRENRIEKAKGLLMKYRNKSEEEAFHYIRDISKKRNMAMVKVAEMMIDQYEK